MAVAVKPAYLLLAGGGAVVLWSGVKGHKWTTTLRDLISGQPIPSTKDLAITQASFAYGYGQTPSAQFPATGVGGSVAKNMAIGRTLAAVYGWGGGNEWSSLVALWNQESGWNNRARNPGSGAYGIPQALPPSKLPLAGQAPVSSATAQITWGLEYIKQRYGDPVAAEAHERANNWY